MGMLRRVQGGGKAGVPVGDVPWDPATGIGQALWEFLTCTTWTEDGTVRETGTMLVFGDGRAVKFMLNDRDQSRVAFVTLAAEEDLWEAAETALLSASTDWRAAKKLPGKK